jgi:hypothetical protein
MILTWQRIISLAALLGITAGCIGCVNVKKSENGDNVDVKTPFGSVSVRTDEVKPEETGLNVYPGAKLVPKRGHDDDKANVNISSPWGELKVVALSYQSDDAPDKVLEWYRKDIAQRYGRLLECKGGTSVSFHGGDDRTSRDLTCEQTKVHAQNFDFNTDEKDSVELKAGTNDRQHIVAVKPEGSGSHIALVYVQKHGEKDSI